MRYAGSFLFCTLIILRNTADVNYQYPIKHIKQARTLLLIFISFYTAAYVQNRWHHIMTDLQKENIISLRSKGLSYTDIAASIGIPRETIKSFCRRNGMVKHITHSHNENTCRNCGSPIIQNPKARKKVFCSAACRTAWWKSHPHALSPNRTCLNCGKPFSAYGVSPQKYCSHSCYINARFSERKKEVVVNG